MTPRLRTAVFPVAGLGTRFLPATKAVPKEMLTVVDRPVIQYAVDEARAAGIEHFVMVTGRGKVAIEDHFDLAFELETTLRERNKKAALEELVSERPAAGAVSFTRQQEPLGLGHAVWCARDLVGDEPFALLLPDVLVQAQDKSCLAQMMEVYKERGGNVIAVEEKPAHELDQYGVVSIGEAVVKDRVWPLTGMVEKPAKGTAPSSLTIMGRYILQPEIMTLLSARQKGAGGEIQVTDAMQRLLEQQPFWALRYAGRSFDCGSKVGFLTANLAFALEREDLAAPLRAEIAKLV